MKQTGYKMKEYGIPTKRYCQTLDLKDDPELISEYRKRHTENEAWPEILQGIRSVGILEMEIYHAVLNLCMQRYALMELFY